jgi:DNA-binding FadR family transcriptional regulator
MPGKTLAVLRRPKLLHTSVQEAVKSYIAANGLAAGMKLPAEGELAEQLGVSRGSVREAMRALESIGIVETRRGVGVFVADFSLAALIDNLAYGLRGALREIAEVLQIRRALEVSLVGETVRLAGPEDIATLRRITERMRARAVQGRSFAEEDQQFHQALFACLGNATLLHLLDVFWLAFFKAASDLTLENAEPLRTWADHQAIVDAIAARDVARARQQLDTHYDGIAGLLAERGRPKTEETTG